VDATRESISSTPRSISSIRGRRVYGLLPPRRLVGTEHNVEAVRYLEKSLQSRGYELIRSSIRRARSRLHWARSASQRSSCMPSQSIPNRRSPLLPVVVRLYGTAAYYMYKGTPLACRGASASTESDSRTPRQMLQPLLAAVTTRFLRQRHTMACDNSPPAPTIILGAHFDSTSVGSPGRS
jgi:hypothetical protein